MSLKTAKINVYGSSKSFTYTSKVELRLTILKTFNITRLPNGVGKQIKSL